jgi:phosphohistidine phosphatase
MRVLLIRHADALPGEPDDLRPLSPDGRAAARELGKRLAADGVRPDVILSSPLLRARETAEALAAELGCEAEKHEALAPGATVDGLRAATAGRGETVVAVAHQPDCGQIAEELTGAPAPPFPPGGVAELELA